MNYLKKINFGIIFLSLMLAVVTVSIVLCVQSSVVKKIIKSERINCLLIGTDLVDNARHSDTLMFLSYEPRTRFVDVLSIPRDTRIKVEGYNLKRINSVFAYHFRKTKDARKAAAELRDVVEVLLSSGSARVEIPYFVEVNYQSFKNIIDFIGGIKVKIDRPMHYDDNVGGLHIHFDPGRYNLNGKKALEYVRYRDKSGDMGRIFRQQKFLKKVVYKFGNPVLVLKIPRLFRELLNNVNTNLSYWDITNLLLELKGLDTKNMRLFQLPGRPRGSYWIVDTERNKIIIDLMGSKETPVDYVRRGREKMRDTRREDIKIEIFNASDKKGLAKRVTDLLRKEGFDVVSWGNAQEIYDNTIIVDRTGNIAPAQAVADILNKSDVISRIEMSRMVDISLYIGKDFDD